MDNLEKFVLRNREDFDQGVPSLKVWAEIDRTLEEKTAKRVSIRRFRAIAAAAAVLLIACIAGMSYMEDRNFASANTIADLAPEYAELERFYAKEVDQKVQQLASYQHDSFVKEDLSRLDNLFEELMDEYKNAPKGTEDQIIQAMINNYQTKINILERVLDKVQSTNSKLIPENILNGEKTEDDEIISI